jgi:hypothetical protein
VKLANSLFGAKAKMSAAILPFHSSAIRLAQGQVRLLESIHQVCRT